MNSMFYNCSSLNSLPDISKWNTSNVKNMSSIFIINDPVIKVEIFEALEKIFDFGEDDDNEENKKENSEKIIYLGKQNLSQHKQFIILLLTEIIRKTSIDDLVTCKTDDDMKSKFVEYLYGHFKKNDLPDYELCFLRLIYYIVSDDDNTKILLSNFHNQEEKTF